MNDPSGGILLVEDDRVDVMTVQRALKRRAISIPLHVARTATEALALLRGEDQVRLPSRPELILLDLNLPDMSGTDILERVKSDERLRRAPVVILTTTDDKVEIQRCYDLGCNVYITKPVDYEAFAGAIQQLGLFLSVMQAPEI